MTARHSVMMTAVAVSVILGATPGSADDGVTVRVTESLTEFPGVSQPPAFSSSGTTVVAPRTRIQVWEGGRRRPVVILKGASLEEMEARFNELRIRPRHIAAYLRALKRAGHLQGRVIAR